MVRPSLKLEENYKEQLRKDVVGILEDLVSTQASKKNLQIAARCYRLGKNMSVNMTHEVNFERILRETNKHEIDFIAELGEKY